MTSDQIGIELGSAIIDEATADSQGNVYMWSKLDGWFDSPQMSLITQQRSGLGLIQTVNDVGGRVLSLEGAIIAQGGKNGALNDSAFQSMAVFKAAIQALFAPTLLVVHEGWSDLQALVWQTGPAHFDIDGSGGDLVAVRFQVPLIAPDPRRYAGFTVQNLTAGSNVVTNPGDLPTPVILTVVGAANPTFQNTSITSEPELLYAGAAGGATVIINTDTEDVEENGVPHRSKLVVAQWWQLLPGANNILVSDDCTIGFSGAYS